MDQSFGEYIKQIRETKKLSLRKVGELSGVSNAYLSQLETGKRGIPSPDIIRNIATALNISYELLLEKAGHLDSDLQDDLKEWNLFGQELMEKGYSLEEIISSIKTNIIIYNK